MTVSSGKLVPKNSPNWLTEFARRLLLTLPLAGFVWAIAVHPYNRLLCRTTETLLHAWEKPNASRLDYRDHVVNLRRLDFSEERGYLYRIRVTDLHFPTILAWALLTATPKVSWSHRLRALGGSTPLLFGFHILQLAVFVQAVYATQLGPWSEAHYSFFARNAWGLTNHVIDLALKFALPFALWTAWFYRDLLASKSNP